MKNPAQSILDQASVGLKTFTEEAGVAQTSAQELLWGFYPDVPPRLAKALGRITHDYGLDYEAIFAPEQTLNEAYHRWQRLEREALRGTVGSLPVGIGTISPFQEFINATAPTGLRTFCTLLKLPRATTQRYASGATRTMPTTIRAALEQVEYPHIKQLEAMQLAWL